MVSIGVIGGSGIYEMEGLRVVERVEVETPFGRPSAPVTIGELDGRRVAFLPRHGTSHEFGPSKVPYRANIWALKSLGVFWTIGIGAVGSLREEIAPGDVVIPDDVIDKTYKRANTLYDEIVVHVQLAQPFHHDLRAVLLKAARSAGLEGPTIHDGGTYVAMEGPAFSTRAESELHRRWGASLIGMTAMPEARLAREAELCYASIALPTDYDVWREGAHEIDVAEIMAVLKRNQQNVARIVRRAVGLIALGTEEECEASRALAYAIITRPEAIDASTRERFALTLGKYLS